MPSIRLITSNWSGAVKPPGADPCCPGEGFLDVAMHTQLSLGLSVVAADRLAAAVEHAVIETVPDAVDARPLVSAGGTGRLSRSSGVIALTGSPMRRFQGRGE